MTGVFDAFDEGESKFSATKSFGWLFCPNDFSRQWREIRPTVGGSYFGANFGQNFDRNNQRQAAGEVGIRSLPAGHLLLFRILISTLVIWIIISNLL